MISGLSAGYGIHINNGYYGSPWIDATKFDAGRLRMIGSTMEVYTGSSWVPVTNGTTQVELDQEIVGVLSWARTKMAEEAKIKKLAENFPVIADLQSKLDMMVILLQDHPQPAA